MTSFTTPSVVLEALKLLPSEPAAGTGSFLINPPFAISKTTHHPTMDRTNHILHDGPPPDGTGRVLAQPEGGFNHIELALPEEWLADAWNAQADEFNQWNSLESSEQLAWAQSRAVAVDRNRRDALAQPGGKDPTDDEILAALRPLYGDQSAADMGAEDDLRTARAALAQPEEEGALLHPAYEPGDGSADGAQLVGGQWWHPGLATTESCGVFALTPVSPVVITAPVARPQQKGRLSLRLPEAQLQQLEAIASRHGVPRCDAARDLLAQALAALEVAE